MRERIEAVLDELRPFLRAEGADIEFIEINEQGILRVRLSGACADCSRSMPPLMKGIERVVLEQIPEVKGVAAV